MLLVGDKGTASPTMVFILAIAIDLVYLGYLEPLLRIVTVSGYVVTGLVGSKFLLL